MRYCRSLTLIAMLLVLAGCSKPPPMLSYDPKDTSERWYTDEQVDVGERVYRQYCIACHGNNGQGSPNWRPDSDVNLAFAPPPIDSTSNAWTLAFPELIQIISQGRNSMPGVDKQISRYDVLAVLAYMQTFWDAETYLRWQSKNSQF